MLEQPVTKRTSLPLKFLVGFAAGALLGFGLCTAGAMRGGQGWGNAAVLGGGCFLVCTAGMVGSFIWWIVVKAKQ